MTTTPNMLRPTVQALLDSNVIALAIRSAADPVGLAEIRCDLIAEGHRDVVEALVAEEIAHAYPVVTFRGVEHPGGACLISEDPANPHAVLTPADAVVDSLIGGQFDDLWSALATADDAEFIGAGDDVVILRDGREGVLVDAAERATVNVDGEWISEPLAGIAHPDSPLATNPAQRALRLACEAWREALSEVDFDRATVEPISDCGYVATGYRAGTPVLTANVPFISGNGGDLVVDDYDHIA